MKLREKIDQIDNRIDMLNKTIWYMMNKLDIDPSDIIDAEAKYRRESEIADLKNKAERLGLKINE